MNLLEEQKELEAFHGPFQIAINHQMLRSGEDSGCIIRVVDESERTGNVWFKIYNSEESELLSTCLTTLAEIKLKQNKNNNNKESGNVLKLYFRQILYVKVYGEELSLAGLGDELLKCRNRQISFKQQRMNNNCFVNSSSSGYFELLEEEYGRVLDATEAGNEDVLLYNWRFTRSNEKYLLCSTYSQIIPVPLSISDSVLLHASKFRVRNRLPIVSYVYGKGGVALMRSGQPLVGLTQRRCIQDEKLIEAVGITAAGNSTETKLLIVDARPTSSAVANTVIGAGFERIENYQNSERIFLNLENIHVIREGYDQLNLKIRNIMKDDKGGNGGDLSLWSELEMNCTWLEHVRGILEGVAKIVQAMHSSKSVLVHCSDGWDRTTQLVSLTQLCLDPFYRSKGGFIRLILKDWLSAGHRFSDRNGHLLPILKVNLPVSDIKSKSTWEALTAFLPKPTQNEVNGTSKQTTSDLCPIFLQFIECVIQLTRQFPMQFGDLDDTFLIELVDDVMADLTGFFRGNCEADRLGLDGGLIEKYLKNGNLEDIGDSEDHMIVPNSERSKMFLWPAYYKRFITR